MQDRLKGKKMFENLNDLFLQLVNQAEPSGTTNIVHQIMPPLLGYAMIPPYHFHEGACRNGMLSKTCMERTLHLHRRPAVFYTALHSPATKRANESCK